jgi:hypothetical protein
MRLYEFSDADPLRIKLTAVANQLSTQDEPMTTDEFLTVLNKNGITVDKADLFNMIKQNPLKNIIKDIEKDTVIFKGQEHELDGQEQGPDENEKIRQQMASKAIS